LNTIKLSKIEGEKMKVIDLIKRLEELPGDAEIGTFDADDRYISNGVQIFDKEDSVYCDCDYIKIKDIESGRKSNEYKICDFYIG